MLNKTITSDTPWKCLFRTHNPLVPGSSPGGPTTNRDLRTLLVAAPAFMRGEERFSAGDAKPHEFVIPPVPGNEGWVPHCPDFLRRLVALIHSLRLSLMKGAHADL
jgi:hypothetical protein